MSSQGKDVLADCLLWFVQQQGLSMTYASLVEGLPLTNGCLSPSNYARAAHRAGLNAEVKAEPLKRFSELLLPCVLLLKNNKACILQHIDANKAVIVLPELNMQLAEITLKELSEQYTGYCIYTKPQYIISQQHKTEKPIVEKHWFWDQIKKCRSLYRDIIFAALLINLFALSMPLFVMNVYDRVVPNKATDTLWVLAIGIAVVICADLILKILRAWFVEIAAIRIDKSLSAKIMQRVLGAQLKFKPKSVGSFASNIQSFESIRSFTGSMVVSALVDLPFFFLFVLIIGLISWYMIIPVLVGAAVVVIYALMVQSKLQQLSELIGQASAQRNSGLIESLASTETLKAFNASSKVQSKWESATDFLSASASKMRLLGGSVGMSAAWVQQIVAVSMIIVGVYLVINGEMSQGALIASYMLSSRAMAPLSQVASLLTQYYQASTSLHSLDEIMRHPQDRPIHKQYFEHERIRGDIKLENVSFKYDEEADLALRNINLTIKAGERIAILGQVGSGKSTLKKLLLGLYQPTSGMVQVDNINLSQLDPANYRNQVSYVPQDPSLVSGTIYENVILGLHNPSNSLVLKAIKNSGLSRTIGQHADGLGMQVGEQGANLSGGQKQAIAVARAMIREGAVYLLDEPTSAMDSVLERQVAHSLQEVTKNKTLILITHKMSLLSLVDRVILMDAGKIIADGPKQQVLAALKRS